MRVDVISGLGYYSDMKTMTTDELRELAAEARQYSEEHAAEYLSACEKLIPIYKARLADPDRCILDKRLDASVLEQLEKGVASCGKSRYLPDTDPTPKAAAIKG